MKLHAMTLGAALAIMGPRISATFAADRFDQGAESPACKIAIAQLVMLTNAAVAGVSPSGDNTFLKHPAASDSSLTCAPYQGLLFSANWHNAYPPALFFAYLDVASSIVSPSTKAAAMSQIKKCYFDALRSKDELAEAHLKTLEIDCQAFTRDGGGVSITLAENHRE